ADVEDRAAHHLTDRREPDRAHGRELLDREVRGERGGHGAVNRCSASAAAALVRATLPSSRASTRDQSSRLTVRVDSTTPPDSCRIRATGAAPTPSRESSYRWSPIVTATPTTAGSRRARRAFQRPSRVTRTNCGGSAADSTLSRKPE